MQKLLNFTSSRRVGFWLIAGLCVLVCGVPLVNLVRLGLPHFDLSIFFEAAWVRVLSNTVLIAILSTAAALLLGLISAYCIHRTDLPFAAKLKTLVLYPYIIPTCLTAIAWTILGNPIVGWLKPIVPWINVYSITGVVFVEALYWYTFVFLNVSATLVNLDTSLEESARMCGARPWQVFWHVTMPLLKQTLLASSLIVFSCVASSFAVPAIVGGPGKVFVITTKIYQLVKIGTPDAILQAMAVSLPILLFAFGMIYFAEKRLSAQAYATLGGKATRKVTVALRQWRWPMFAFLFFLSLLAFILPGITLILASFMQSLGQWRFSLANYSHVFVNPETYASVLNSFALAIVGACILTFMGFFISYYKMKSQYRGRNLLVALSSLPFATPGTILALAILFTLTGWPAFVLLLLAYVAKYLSHAIKVMTPAISTVHISLEEASLMCGASWFTTLRTIWLPVVKMAISSCLFLMIAPLFSELTMSIMLTNTDFPTIGTRLFHLQEYGSPNEASVLAVLILFLVIMLNFVTKKLSRGRLGI